MKVIKKNGEICLLIYLALNIGKVAVLVSGSLR